MDTHGMEAALDGLDGHVVVWYYIIRLPAGVKCAERDRLHPPYARST